MVIKNIIQDGKKVKWHVLPKVNLKMFLECLVKFQFCKY